MSGLDGVRAALHDVAANPKPLKQQGSLIEAETERSRWWSRVQGLCVLIVESENDQIVPHPAVASYLSSFIAARSVTCRVIAGADHALSDPESHRSYDQLLSSWLREMIFGAR